MSFTCLLVTPASIVPEGQSSYKSGDSESCSSKKKLFETNKFHLLTFSLKSLLGPIIRGYCHFLFLKLTLEQKCIKKTLKGMTRGNWSPISTSYLNFKVGAQMALGRTQSCVFFSIFFIFFYFPTPSVHKMNFLR